MSRTKRVRSSAGARVKAAEIERQVVAGERILEIGEVRRELYVIREGRVRMQGGSDASERVLGPGELFGEVSAISGLPAPYRVEALADTTLLVLDVALLNRLCGESQEFALRLIRSLANDLGRALEGAEAPVAAVAQAEQDGAISALSRAILLHAGKPGGPPVVKGKLQDLAGAANLPLLEAYHALHELIDRGCLRLVDDPLTVLDRDQLESAAAS